MRAALIIILCSVMMGSSKLSAITHLDSLMLDSLKSSLVNIRNIKAKGNTYNQISDLYYYYNLDSSFYYAQEYLKTAKRAKDSSMIAHAQYNIAYIFDEKGDILKALDLFQQALQKYQILQDTYYVASSYCNIGYMTSYGADQAKGLSYFLEAMNLAELIQDTGLMCDLNANIGYYYERVGDVRTAYNYYNKSLELNHVVFFSKSGTFHLFALPGPMMLIFGMFRVALMKL